MKKGPLSAHIKTALCMLTAVFMMINTVRLEAQIEKTLQFIPETLDFGTIRETDGKITRSVQAVNISSDSTLIISARTSCGCSEAEYDGRMMAPGDTTIVKITYDPMNRPGKFTKTAKIFTGEERVGNILRIKGTVIPSKRHLDKVYPEKAGRLRLSSMFVAAGEMRRAETKPIFVGIYNDSETPIALTAESDNEALEVALLPEILEPAGISTISLMLKGKNIGNDVKEFTIKVTVKNSETGERMLEIPVTGAIKQPSEQRAITD